MNQNQRVYQKAARTERSQRMLRVLTALPLREIGMKVMEALRQTIQELQQMKEVTEQRQVLRGEIQQPHREVPVEITRIPLVVTQVAAQAEIRQMVPET